MCRHLLSCLVAFGLLTAPVLADPLASSPRPLARPALAVPEVTRNIGGALYVRLLPGASLRPKLRPAAITAEVNEARTRAAASFEAWMRAFRPRALSQGISARTFDRAFAQARFNQDVIARDRNQSEFNRAIWDYLDSAVSDKRVANGRAALQQHRAVLDRIEARYGVEREVVVAVWGMESAYGEVRGDIRIVDALATLAHDGRRGAFFEQQLIAALKILENGDTSPENMTGSWAGAMGHTQFIPTSYLAYAVDFDGDGRRDIWSDDPTDALASTAAYLDRFGWIKGMPWGVEVQLPDGFDHATARRDIKRMPSDWARLGVVGMDGRAVRDFGAASLLLPAGARGPAFLISKNFEVIERYNTADAYVMGVGHLSDRLAGRGPITGNWPRDDRALSSAERKELQRRLTAKGFSTGGVDGRFGPRSKQALRAYQRRAGLPADGFASFDMLKRLR